MKIRKWYIIGFIIIFIAIIGFIILLNKPEDRLTEEQIAALREEYPICTSVGHPTINYFTPSLEAVKQRVDSFVYGEIIEVETIPWTAVYECDYYKYTISVMDATKRQDKKLDKIVVSNYGGYISFKPNLKKGMKVVMPVCKTEDSVGTHECTLVGIYYVTEDDYVLSAFDEEKSEVTPPLSGIKLKKLMRELKK